jgi:Xaa-Pro aminopeptidase
MREIDLAVKAGANAAVPSFVSSPTGVRGMSIFSAQGPGFGKVRRNEPVLVDYPGSYGGYLADETRIFCEKRGAKLGYQDFLGGPPGSKAGFVGHGVGLQIDEYPVIGPVDHEIAENMTILVGANGAERLTRLPQESWRV